MARIRVDSRFARPLRYGPTGHGLRTRGQAVRMTLRELIETFIVRLEASREHSSKAGLDHPITLSKGRLLATVGTLHLYEFELPPASVVGLDVPVTILPQDEMEPTEGVILGQSGQSLTVQTFDAIGQFVPSATLVPDATGFLSTASKRLAEMALQADRYSLGPAERLAPWLASLPSRAGTDLPGSSTSVLTTLWQEVAGTRRQQLAVLATELIRTNKRVLLVSRDHRTTDELLGQIARTMKAAGMSYKSWLSRYELAMANQVAGIPLQDLGFEAQMHQFYAKSRSEKAALRRKYDRFRELTPFLAQKAQKQRDLDEVRLLEWRLLTQLSELQAKTKEVDATLAEYDNLPLWKRLGLQTLGKNVETLQEYRAIYQQRARELMSELDMAKKRIEELVPEAAVPKDMRPEFEELKTEVKRLGGTKRIREMLAAEEGTNRQAFMQNRRLVATTASRVVTDPLFGRVRFDVLLVDEAPLIPAPFLIAAAGIVSERIILSGDPRDLAVTAVQDGAASIQWWEQPGQPAPTR